MIRFRVTDLTDAASEVHTLVRLDGSDDLLDQVTSGPDLGDDFVGLYDLEGDPYTTVNATWTAVTEAPVHVVEKWRARLDGGPLLEVTPL